MRILMGGQGWLLRIPMIGNAVSIETEAGHGAHSMRLKDPARSDWAVHQR